MSALPVKLGLSEIMRMKAESMAMARALRWAAADPHYDGIAVSRREMELMQLALRCLTKPTDADIQLVALEAAGGPPAPTPASQEQVVDRR